MGAGREAGKAGQAGQATVEWTALVLLVALLLGAAAIVLPAAAGSGLARAVLHAITCAVRGGCDEGGPSLAVAYGRELAGTVRRYAPNIVYERRSAELPIDFRRCRALDCSNGPDEQASIDRSSADLPVTAFTRVVDRRGAGGSLYVQYWFYYPESFSGGVGRALGPLQKEWPGYHPDDWEGYEVRIAADGSVSARATAHGGYRSSKHSKEWGAWTGWYRVSGGSHAGHLVPGPTGERSTSKSSLSLVPIETMPDKDLYRFDVSPPWQKGVYVDPESPSS